MTKSPVTCWNAGRFIGVTVGGRRTGQRVDETMLPRRRANKCQPSRCDIFLGSVGTRGPSRGVSGARRGPRHEGAVQARWERVREQKERERAVGKAAGDECVFIPGEGPSW
jgi:hypothetical protein